MKLHFFNEDGELIHIDKKTIVVIGTNSLICNCVDRCSVDVKKIYYSHSFLLKWEATNPGKVIWNGYYKK